jgi:hypothetical protein
VISHDGVAPIVTPHDDCMLVMHSLRQAQRGVTIMRFAGRMGAHEWVAHDAWGAAQAHA